MKVKIVVLFITTKKHLSVLKINNNNATSHQKLSTIVLLTKNVPRLFVASNARVRAADNAASAAYERLFKYIIIIIIII